MPFSQRKHRWGAVTLQIACQPKVSLNFSQKFFWNAVWIWGVCVAKEQGVYSECHWNSMRRVPWPHAGPSHHCQVGDIRVCGFFLGLFFMTGCSALITDSVSRPQARSWLTDPSLVVAEVQVLPCKKPFELNTCWILPLLFSSSGISYSVVLSSECE